MSIAGQTYRYANQLVLHQLSIKESLICLALDWNHLNL
jgi:hypothetical protein